MVIVQLSGGLGRQMFQYAAGRMVAQRTGVPLRLDIRRLQENSTWRYHLHHLRIRAKVATPEEVEALIGSPRGLRGRVYRALQPYIPPARRRILQEYAAGYLPEIQEVSGFILLVGEWQSEKYFFHFSDMIRNEFQVNTPVQPQTAELLLEVQDTHSVSVHVRRGDLVSDPVNLRTRGVCSPEYYEAAQRVIAERVNRPHFYVFSDDIPWVQENLTFLGPVTYITHNGPDRDYEDLRLMSFCQHHIIANSAFSWWGAWLGKNPRRNVIAPRQWFRDPDRDTRDLIPPAWIRI